MEIKILDYPEYILGLAAVLAIIIVATAKLGL